MSHLNVEIKAQCADHPAIRNLLESRHAEGPQTIYQTDTYFNCPQGKLKLREAPNYAELIHYLREEIQGPKQSLVTFYKPSDVGKLKTIMEKAYGILVIVQKQREIYKIENVKFHLDTVTNLGTYVEIEAIDYLGNISQEKLYTQCREFLDLFQIPETDLISCSYSDLLLGIGH